MDLHIDGMEMPRATKRKRKKERRKSGFTTQWVKVSERWIKALQQSDSVSTYRLALIILSEAFKREQVGGEIVLSTAVTGMNRATRGRAIKELVVLRLIKVERRGNTAARVSHIY
jgi:hypothetical protein